MIKIVYFDEESASDYLDITAGGKAQSTSEDVKKRTTDIHADVEAKLSAKFSWLPFLGTSGDIGAGAGFSRAGESILSKTLSNTILTDYLTEVERDNRIEKLENFQVSAPKDSMAFMKMFTPYMVVAKTEDQGIDIARMDEALEKAKGYYELIGKNRDDDSQLILRFNIKAFRNNYGLTDLARMDLVFHGIRVGRTAKDSLDIQAEMSQGNEPTVPNAAEIIDGFAIPADDLLNVYDVVLAGVEYAK